MTDPARERIATCPAWCSVSHDDWERSEHGRAIHRLIVGRVKANCHPDMDHGVSVALMLSDRSPYNPLPPELRLVITWYCPDQEDPVLAAQIAVKEAAALAAVLTAFRKSDPLAPLLRKAADLAASTVTAPG